MLISVVGFAQSSPLVEVIPQPLKVNKMAGNFVFSENTILTSDKESAKELQLLQKELEEQTGLLFTTAGKGTSNTINLKIAPEKEAGLGNEGYHLEIKTNTIELSAPTLTGIFYGIQTLKQLLKKSEQGKTYAIACMVLEDKPRFSWRAFMLDEGRYFKGAAVVKSLLDEMALLKMNVFHWHLTDDQGWRIQIKKYPLLTSIGSKRDSTQIGGWNSPKFDGKIHQGFYTQDQIKELIAYAADRHITIVPEIEIPGHASAAIASYAWLGSSGKTIKVPTTFGVKEDVYNVANPKTMQFIEDVLTEIMDLFPSKVIHIGGDEVKYNQWKASPQIQDFMKEKGLQSPADLQIWTTNKISNFLQNKGRRMMGWNEIVGDNANDYTDGTINSINVKLAPNTLVHFWKGELILINEAIEKGYDVVNSFHEATYLDYGYDYITMEKAYNFDPIPKGLKSKYQSKIKGLGCQMWGEWIPTIADMNEMVYPKITAYSEVGWTAPANKNYKHFTKSLPFFYARWEKKGIGYYR